jgi:NACalpha-BTF3-like transcription factor
MQREKEVDFPQRTYYYSHSVGVFLLKEGSSYSELPNIMTIGILDNTIFHNKGSLVQEVSHLYYEDKTRFGCAQNVYYQLPEFRLDLNNITKVGLIQGVFKAKTFERLERINDLWNKSFKLTPGGDLMDNIVQTLVRANTEPLFLEKLQKNFGYAEKYHESQAQIKEMRQQNEELKKQLEEKEKQIQLFPAQLEAKFEELRKELRESQAHLVELVKNGHNGQK